jgi:endonuclease/exonuclease/phosphatase family metal-dependent hydrolase
LSELERELHVHREEIFYAPFIIVKTVARLLIRTSQLAMSLLSNIAQPEEAHKWSLNIMFCNLFLRPTSLFADAQMQRTEAFIQQMKTERYQKYDVLCLCEVFDSACHNLLIRALALLGYKFATKVLGEDQTSIKNRLDYMLAHRRLLALNGGVIIFSKHPILETDSGLFQTNENELSLHDGMASKGFMYAKIQRQPEYKCCNIIVTHFEAARGEEGNRRRIREARKIGQFVQSKASIFQHEPLLFVGDFNEDKPLRSMSNDDTWGCILSKLGAAEFIHGITDVTIDPARNSLVGRDGDTEIERCRLDHCLYGSSTLKPVLSTSSCHALRLQPLQLIEYYATNNGATKPEIIYDLSDHYALDIHVEFPNACFDSIVPRVTHKRASSSSTLPQPLLFRLADYVSARLPWRRQI